MPVRWDTVTVDGKPMRVNISVPESAPRGTWGEMLAFFAQHLKA
jgi:hypothetical protein